jgi:hypothetical protein
VVLIWCRSVRAFGARRSSAAPDVDSIDERAAGGASGRVDAPALRALGMPDPDSIGAVAARLVRNHEHAHGGDKRERREGRDRDCSRDQRDQHGRPDRPPPKECSGSFETGTRCGRAGTARCRSGAPLPAPCRRRSPARASPARCHSPRRVASARTSVTSVDGRSICSRIPHHEASRVDGRSLA